MLTKGAGSIKKSRIRSIFKGFLPLYVLAHFAHHVLTALPQPLAPFIRDEFNLSYTRTTLVNSAFAWSYGTAQIPAGYMADRIGQRVLLIIGICGVALAGILVGLSQTYVMLLSCMVVMGILGGGYHPAAAPMVANSVAPENRGRALGFHEIGASASFLVSPLIAAGIATATGWRSSYIWLAIPTMLIGLFLIRFTRRAGTGEGTSVEETGPDGEDIAARPGRIRRLVAFLLLSVMTGGIANSVTSMIALFAVDVHGATETGAASLLVVVSSAGLWVSPLGGYLSDRLGRIPLVIGASLMSAGVVYLLNLAPYWWGLALMMLLMGIATFIRMPVSEAFIMEQTTERRRSTIYGIYYFAMTETGAIFAPIMGYLVDNYGFTDSYTWASIAIIVVTLGSLWFLRGSRG